MDGEDIDFSIVFGSQEEAIAYFDRLGLMTHDCDPNDPADQVVPGLFHLATLLRSLVPRTGQRLQSVRVGGGGRRAIVLTRMGGGWVARWACEVVPPG